MAEGVRITVTDLATGESESAEICNDYLLVTDGTYYLDGVQTHANGASARMTGSQRSICPLIG